MIIFLVVYFAYSQVRRGVRAGTGGCGELNGGGMQPHGAWRHVVGWTGVEVRVVNRECVPDHPPPYLIACPHRLSLLPSAKTSRSSTPSSLRSSLSFWSSSANSTSTRSAETHPLLGRSSSSGVAASATIGTGRHLPQSDATATSQSLTPAAAAASRRRRHAECSVCAFLRFCPALSPPSAPPLLPLCPPDPPLYSTPSPLPLWPRREHTHPNLSPLAPVPVSSSLSSSSW